MITSQESALPALGSHPGYSVRGFLAGHLLLQILDPVPVTR